MQRLLKRRGLDPGDADLVQSDPVVDESPALAGISSASIQGRIALGPRAGARVWRVGADPDAPWVLSTASRHAHLAGFDLHANVAMPAADRARLEQLCRDRLRPAVEATEVRQARDEPKVGIHRRRLTAAVELVGALRRERGQVRGRQLHRAHVLATVLMGERKTSTWPG